MDEEHPSEACGPHSYEDPVPFEGSKKSLCRDHRPIMRDVAPPVTRTARRSHASEYDVSDQPPMTVNVNQPEPSFPVTLSAVYYELRSLSSKFDALAGLPHDVNDHENRIRDLATEQSRAYAEIARAKAEADSTYVTKTQARWAIGTLMGLVVAVTGVLALILK